MRLAIAALLLAFGATAAHAEDWSSFIDPNPSKPVASKPVTVAPDGAKPMRVAKATPKAKPKAKAKAKTKARTKARHK